MNDKLFFEVLCGVATFGYGECENHNAVVIDKNEVEILLHYPFEKDFRKHIKSENGFTIKQLVDEIRAAYFDMYEGSVNYGQMPNSYNEKVISPKFGTSYHSIDDLVIEGIEYDLVHHVVNPYIGS